ncbi:MAG: methylmalonyl Co-A mutase-associated GTPase MeaB, partial [Paracoccaceae bacterium]
ADLILVNKADGDLKAAAMRTCADYTGALRLLRHREYDPPGFPKAMLVSALSEAGLQVAWDEMQALANWRKAHGHWDRRRAAQARHWFEHEVRHELLAQLGEAKVQARMIELGDQVSQGALAESAAARALLEALKNR